MEKFFTELKRRHIYRVAAAYAVVAWVLLQLVNNLAPALSLPNWVATTVVVLLAVGFPVALLFSWIQHLAPAEGAAQQARTNRLDWLLAGGLAAVIGIFLFQELEQRPASSVPASASGAQAASISIAVLPFANLSGDDTQKFFSDGMTDEISSALAKVPGLTVLARSSSFALEIQNLTARDKGRTLNARYLVEGSVRKAGDQVRITAQLVQAENGVSLWTDNYDRELKNIFATQEDIAQAIAGALKVPLGLRAGDTLVRNRTNDTAIYDQYLRARALVRQRGLKPLTDGAALLEEVVARDPNYAPAWAMLAQTYELRPGFYPEWFAGSAEGLRSITDQLLPKAETAAQKAIKADPKLAGGYVNLALVQELRGKLIQAEEFYMKALAVDPNDPEALHWYGEFHADVGRLKEALAMRERLQALEPFVPVFSRITADIRWLNGETDAAIAIYKTTPNVVRPTDLTKIYAGAGRYQEAADFLLEIPGDIGYAPEALQAAARLLRAAPAPLGSSEPRQPLGELSFVYLYRGESEPVLDFYEADLEAGYSIPIGTALLWHTSFAPVRKTERYKAFLRKGGYVEYWRAKGWPEFCHPVGADDFVCD